MEDLYRWEQEKHLADVRELEHNSLMQRALAAYFLFIYKEKRANDVTPPNEEGRLIE